MLRIIRFALALMLVLPVFVSPARAEKIKPIVVVFGFESGMTVAEEFEDFLAEALVYGLLEQDEIKVVEREMLDKILAEQQISNSELADADTRVKLARLIGAQFTVAGVYFYEPLSESVSVLIRVIETEASQLKSFEYSGFKSSIETVLEEEAGPEIAEFVLNPDFE